MPDDLDSALTALASGLLVGIPTETVYGVAADPFSAEAVKKLLMAKVRPEDRPLPLLVADVAGAVGVARLDARALAIRWPREARHWPNSSACRSWP